jgi:hypothetical protein
MLRVRISRLLAQSGDSALYQGKPAVHTHMVVGRSALIPKRI